jgi:hypothetical protein
MGQEFSLQPDYVICQGCADDAVDSHIQVVFSKWISARARYALWFLLLVRLILNGNVGFQLRL